MNTKGNIAASLTVFERGVASELAQGARVELVGLGPAGGRDIEGYYVLLHRPDGKVLLLLTTLNPKAKFIKNANSVLNFLERMDLDEITIPLLPKVHSHDEIWSYHAKANGL